MILPFSLMGEMYIPQIFVTLTACVKIYSTEYCKGGWGMWAGEIFVPQNISIAKFSHNITYMYTGKILCKCSGKTALLQITATMV